jgi:DNA-binding MarR family transcriptional regulator
LTTGAITTVLDRLERAGFARRTRDPADRRRVLVELAPEAQGGAGDYYGEHMALGERLYRRYSEEQLALLLDFTREGRELNEREAAKLEARTRAQRES